MKKYPLGGAKLFGKSFNTIASMADVIRPIFSRKFDILTYICEKKFFWGQKIRKNGFFQNRSKSHIYVYNGSKTCLGTPKGHFLAIYTYINHYSTLYKKSNFWENSRFFEFLQFLINRISADWPAGGGRNHNSCTKIYSLDILKAFSYSDHHCMTPRLNLMVLWKSLKFPF